VPTVVSIHGLELMIENCTIAKAAARKDELLKCLHQYTGQSQQKPIKRPLETMDNERPNGAEWFRNLMAPKPADDNMQVVIKQEVEVKKAKLDLQSYEEMEIRNSKEVLAAEHKTKMEIQSAELARAQKLKEVEVVRVEIEKDKLRRCADLEVNMKENEMIIHERKLTEMAEIEIEAKKIKVVKAVKQPK
jgi:hypothetical protein